MNPIKVYVYYKGGTLGMAGSPLVPARTVEELLAGIRLPPGVELTLESAEKLVDSTNLTYADRKEGGKRIEANYNTHDAFLFLQGTDTLADTCAALAIGWGPQLQKPVIVLGAMFGKDEPGTDAITQLENAFRVLVAFHQHRVVGVYTVSQDHILHGPRVAKRSSTELKAFHTPGMLPVGWIDSGIRLGNTIRRRTDLLSDHLQGSFEFSRNVVELVATADTSPRHLLALATDVHLRGVILRGKGCGNIPTEPWNKTDGITWIEAIKQVTDNNVAVLVSSPFEGEPVDLNRYNPGQLAQQAGAIGIGNLTFAMMEAKFRHALMKYQNRGSHAYLKRYFRQDIIGEYLPYLR